MQRSWQVLSGILISTAVTMSAGPALGQTCQELWVERNAYYNAAGYCFKTPRAVRYFGKSGCTVNVEADVRLSQPITARIDQIKSKERATSCSGNTVQGPSLSDATCGQLWVERNAYYKGRAYCFNTARAKAHFGNESCSADLAEDDAEGQLSDAVRARIAEISKLERRNDCN